MESTVRGWKVGEGGDLGPSSCFLPVSTIKSQQWLCLPLGRTMAPSTTPALPVLTTLSSALGPQTQGSNSPTVNPGSFLILCGSHNPAHLPGNHPAIKLSSVKLLHSMLYSARTLTDIRSLLNLSIYRSKP